MTTLHTVHFNNCMLSSSKCTLRLPMYTKWACICGLLRCRSKPDLNRGLCCSSY